MDFEFEVPAVKEEKKKYATFTIKPIGGPAEIAKWREMQAAKEANYLLRLGARDQRITEFEATTGQKLDAPQVKTASWQEKLEHAEAERLRLALAEERVAQYTYEREPESKKTLWGRIKSFVKSFWQSANF